MPFERGTFLGASIRGFNSNIGWNMGQPSTLSVQLIEDPINGDAFIPVNINTPIYFQFGSFNFFGLLQKWEKTNDTGGMPTYEAVCVDPREILEGAQVILANYSGSVGPVRNLINVYGFWENQGFGLSFSNEAGIPWTRVRDALHLITNQPAQTAFGGPLTYNGVSYSLDLSQLPQPPAFYRVGGSVSIGLLELIAQICEDGGCDFFVELQGLAIRIRTVSRVAQPPLGTISTLTESAFGSSLVRSRSGLEGRNETTSSFLVGGEVSLLHMTDNMASFWGYDVLGNPVIGVPARLNLTDDRFTTQLLNGLGTSSTLATFLNWVAPEGYNWPNVPLYLIVGEEIIKLTEFNGALGGVYTIERGQFGTTVATHSGNEVCRLLLWSTITDQMALNAAPVADLIGSFSYPCSALEMRLAKTGYLDWATYIIHHRPAVAALVGMTNSIRHMGGVGAAFHPNLVNDGFDNAALMGAAAVEGDIHARELRLYEFVRGYADEYMGQKYLAALPFLLTQLDPETLKISSSYEISDGGYLPEGSAPLGLSVLNEDLFKNEDGRFRCFVVYTDVLGADFTDISPQESVVEDGVLYKEAVVEPGIILTPTPAAVISLRGALTEEAPDTVGDFSIVAAVLQMTPEQAQPALKQGGFGNLMMRVCPPHKNPFAVAVPLKSNILFYGPWYAAGVPGKVRFEQDPSLVPWNYGGYDTLNAAGFARVTESVTNMQVSEAGSMELAGPPTASLGDTLQVGGPNVTNIQVSFGTNGVTTTYSFQTYTPRFGVFSKGSSERLKRLSLANVELRRSLRASANETAARVAIAGEARAARKWMQNAPPAVRRESPHDVVIGYSFADPENFIPQPGFAVPGTPSIRVGVSSATYEEAVAFSNADSSADFRATSIMSWSGLVRPFCTQEGGGVALSSYTEPAAVEFGGNLSKTGLDPWKEANDVEVYTFGDEYTHLHARRSGSDPTNARVFGLRGPLVISGWGWDIEGRPVPPGAGYLKRADLWKTGPVDLLWDDRRGVWTSHDVLKGVVSRSVPENASSSGGMWVYAGGTNTNWELTVYNWGSGTVPVGSKVHALFNVLDEKWYVTEGNLVSAASGTSGGGGASLPTGLIHTVLYKAPPSGDVTWTRHPQIAAMTLGGSGTDGIGTLAFIGSTLAESGGNLLFQTQPRPASQHLTVVYPSGTPATGDYWKVASLAGTVATLRWASTTISGSGGKTMTVEYVSNVACNPNGTGLTVTKRKMDFYEGLLINEY